MKKFLALAVSALMLIAMVPAAMAADTTAMVMYEPDVYNNHNSMSVGSQLGTNQVTGSWMTYSGAAFGSEFSKEDTGNVYLKVTDKEITGSTTTTGDYGAVFQMADSAVTGEDISFEIKVKLPEKNQMMEFKFKENSTSPPNTSYNYGTYIVAHITATDNGYVYNDYYSNGGKDNVIVIAPYRNQWISLKWIFNTVEDSYDLYCNGSFVANIPDAKFHPSGKDSSGATVTPGIKFVQICLSGNGEAWLDDAAFDANVAIEKPLYVNAPVIKSIEDETVITGLVNAPLLNADGSEYGKETGLIIPAVDTSMVGTYTVPVENISGVNAVWDVYRKATVTGYNFDDDNPAYKYISTKEGVNGIFNSPVTADGKALKLGKPLSWDRNHEYTATNVTSDKGVFEIAFDMYWAKPETTETFYINLYNEDALALQTVFTLDTNGSFNYKTNAKLLCSGNTTAAGNKQKFRLVIDRNEQNLQVYLNEALVNTLAFSELHENYRPLAGITKLNFYTYVPDSEKYKNDTDGILTNYLAGLVDVYIDNLYVKTYESVASVDTTAVDTDVTVVKNQIPALTQTVPTTLTDGTVDVLPIKWAAVDTATTGEKSATGTVLGFADTTVNATVNVIELPYTMNVEAGTITITAPTNYTPAGKLYIATYENGVLKAVDIHDTPVSGSTTVSASGDVKVFLLTDALVPLAEAID